MNRDDKQLEMATGIILQRVNEMKASLGNLIMKVELDSHNMSFPDVLDSFAVISGQMNSIMRLLKSEKVPLLKGLTAIPLVLNQDKDTELETLTEGRLDSFNHAVAPDYLRTKPDPEVETRHMQVEARASQVNPDTFNKQAASLTKLANHVLDLISTARDDWEKSEQATPASTSSVVDTQELINSLQTGKAFKLAPPVGPIPRQGAPSSSSAGPAPPGAAKALGTIKTTIKGARNY